MSLAEESEPPISSSSESIVLRLQQCFESCSKAVEDDDSSPSPASILELVEFLDSISDAAICDSDDDATLNNAVAALTYIQSYILNPSVDQAIVDALSFELPKAVAKFAGVSQRCCEIVRSIIDQFTTKCSPRDMIAVLCEALDSYGKTTDAPGYVAAILHGVSKVLLSIQRRHFEQIKVALPIIVKALKAASFDLDDRDLGLKNLFEGAVDIANSIQETCQKMDTGANEQLHALLGLYVFQILAVVSISMGDDISNCLYLVQQLSSFLPYCGLSYSNLLTGQGVDPFISLICIDDTDDYMDSFSEVKHGVILSVIWGHISVEVAQAAGQDSSTLVDEIRSNQSRRWSTVGVLKYVFSFDELPWTLKKHATNFLLAITENLDEQDINEDSFDIPSVISTLQAIISVIMNAPEAELRKNAFVALKRVLADTPATLRLDIMRLLVRTSSSPSMRALLLDCVRENLRNDHRKLQEKKVCSSSFWNADILDLVEFVLKPPTAGPPSLPEQIDAVISALNLYRYVLITESTGKTNYTEVLSRSNLKKVYNEWLLPLQTLLRAISAANKNDYDQLPFDMMCGLNPLEFVLCRCIELVEEKLKQVA